jgi:hypothetical protein
MHTRKEHRWWAAQNQHWLHVETRLIRRTTMSTAVMATRLELNSVADTALKADPRLASGSCFNRCPMRKPASAMRPPVRRHRTSTLTSRYGARFAKDVSRPSRTPSNAFSGGSQSRWSNGRSKTLGRSADETLGKRRGAVSIHPAQAPAPIPPQNSSAAPQRSPASSKSHSTTAADPHDSNRGVSD